MPNFPSLKKKKFKNLEIWRSLLFIIIKFVSYLQYTFCIYFNNENVKKSLVGHENIENHILCRHLQKLVNAVFDCKIQHQWISSYRVISMDLFITHLCQNPLQELNGRIIQAYQTVKQ